MALSSQQIFNKGNLAFEKGNFQKAKKFYKLILKNFPNHSDINHKLGLIALSVNSGDEAISLFKTALDASPETEQFWISLIDALIQEKQFEKAEETIKQAKNHNVNQEKLNNLITKMISIKDGKIINHLKPPQQQINRLLEHYKAGYIKKAYILAKSITKKYPSDLLSWKILGAVSRQTERMSEALVANKTVISLSPKDASAYYNLELLLKN